MMSSPKELVWPRRKTAILVIHGTGEHRPFQALDLFTRNFHDYLETANPGVSIERQHKLRAHKDWVESYLSLTIRPEQEQKQGIELDFYEYYWDCYMVRRPRPWDTFRWIGGFLKGYCKDNAPKAKKERKDQLARFEQWVGETRKMKGNLLEIYDWPNWQEIQRYLWLSKRESIDKAKQDLQISRTKNLIEQYFSLPAAFQYLLGQLLGMFAAIFLRGFLSDVVCYAQSDVRSKYYEIRQKVLTGAMEQLRLLLHDDYEQIIVVGHSLGSVIAYDALNRLRLFRNAGKEDDVSKIRALVTFGSPLMKFTWFYHGHTKPEECFRRQIINERYAWRRRIFSPPEPKEVKPAGPALLHEEMQWLNFYHKFDLASDTRFFEVFAVSDPYEIKDRVFKPRKAHEVYWVSQAMYKRIADQLNWHSPLLSDERKQMAEKMENRPSYQRAKETEMWMQAQQQLP